MDIVYNKRIITFRNHLIALAKEIFETEMKISFSGRRFHYNGYSYPLTIVVFSDAQKVGYCLPDLFEIGIHQSLISKGDAICRDVLRHEIAHLMTHIEYGECPAHGAEFKATCREYGWPEEVSLAQLDMSYEKQIESKVEKLLSLSESSNPNEALAALKKAQELIDKYSLSPHDEEAWIVRRILHTHKLTQKYHTIATILRHFAVVPSFSKGSDGTYLQIFGEEEHVKSAEYIAHFLVRELEVLWNAHTGPRGALAKKSYLIGIAEGFSQKLTSKSQAIIAYTQKVTDAHDHFLNLRGRSRQSTHVDPNARSAGIAKGSDLTITPKPPETLQLT